MKIGDAVEKATSAVGIKPCGGCQKAKPLLNSGSLKDVARGIAMIPGNALSIMWGDVQGIVGEPFQYDLPEKAGVAEGSIPPGLELKGQSLTGTPSQAGAYRLTVAKQGNRKSVTVRILEAE